MTAESAYVLGMIDGPDQVKDLVVTTDHNCLYNETVGNPNDADKRPPYGPSSPTMYTGAGVAITPEHARYREIFGISAGEQIAFHADQSFTSSGIALPIPIRAHTVSFRSAHVA